MKKRLFIPIALTVMELHNNSFVYNYLVGNGVLGKESETSADSTSATYQYDTYGHLIEMKLNGATSFWKLNAQDNFTYDNLNRLTGYAGKTATYNANGNITGKTDVGTFQYNTTGKTYALSGVTSPTGLISQRNQTIAYTSFERPASIAEGDYTAAFTYNGADERVKMELKKNGAKELNRYYISDCYEIDDRATGGITHIANSSGGVVQELSYDAWGQLRNPTNQAVYTLGSEPELFLGRGYTGHEHLPAFGLVNMNARLYDAALGRFLSPDPYVQSPLFSQNFNRYSYVVNNPLKYIDLKGETGLAVLAGFFKGLFTGENILRSIADVSMNEVKILSGLFSANTNQKGWGWQILSRNTWQLPQTVVGLIYANISNYAGQVDWVDSWGGSTVTNGHNWGYTAVTIGSYIIGSKDIAADPDNPLFQHEYGHYLQSQSMGWAFLPRIGLPSLLSANGDGNHKYQPFEQDANRRAFKFFNENVDGFYKSIGDQVIYGNSKGWNFYENPLDVNHKGIMGTYYDYKTQMDLINNSLTLHAKWYDYFGFFSIAGNAGIGAGNGVYYNMHRIK